MGMVNQLGKFRLLLSKKYSWEWGPAQHEAYTKVKLLLTTPPTLALYDVNLPIKITTNSPSYRFRGVIMQQHSEGCHPVAYDSQALTAKEKHYAQIGKETLAVTWTCEKFEDYIHLFHFGGITI